jgi:hypothetical protein
MFTKITKKTLAYSHFGLVWEMGYVLSRAKTIVLEIYKVLIGQNLDQCGKHS